MDLLKEIREKLKSDPVGSRNELERLESENADVSSVEARKL